MKVMAKDFSWGAYFMLGTHMWRCPDDLFGGKMKGDAAQTAPDTAAFSEKYRSLQCDGAEWLAVTERMRAGGLNQIVVDIGEGLRFPSPRAIPNLPSTAAGRQTGCAMRFVGFAAWG